MANIEQHRSQAEASEYTHSSLYRIQRSYIEPVAGFAAQVLTAIDNDGLLLQPARIRMASPTGFRLEAPLGLDDTEPIPAILVDPVMERKTDAIDADMVRTLGLVMEYWGGDYTRRMTDVYNDALVLEADWLTERNIPFLDFDPRLVPLRAITRRLMGDFAFFSDFGIEDWKRELEVQKEDVIKESVIPDEVIDHRRILTALGEDPNEFLTMREEFFGLFDPVFGMGSEWLRSRERESRQTIANIGVKEGINFAVQKKKGTLLSP